MIIYGTVALHILSKGTLDHLREHIEHHTYWRCQQADHQVQNHNDPKMYRIHSMLVTTGRNTGVKIIIEGEESINIPTNTRKC